MKQTVFMTICLALALISCKKEVIEQQTNSGGLRSVSATCGEGQTQVLYAGQHIPAGSVYVSNDESNVFVTFTTQSGWELKKTDLFAGACNAIPTNNGGNPIIGAFPLKTQHGNGTTSYTYVLNKSNLPTCMCIAAHAEVVLRNAQGEIIQSETAWAEGNPFPGKSWATNFSYCIQECSQVCYNTETAWASGMSYTDKGSWATFTPYDGVASSVTLFAGQTLEAGIVSFSEQDAAGNVTISITLNSGWSLQNVTEAVKIQGYLNAPSGNPTVGNFNTYKGNDLTIVVPAYAFFGVHLDVQQEVSCN